MSTPVITAPGAEAPDAEPPRPDFPRRWRRMSQGLRRNGGASVAARALVVAVVTVGVVLRFRSTSQLWLDEAQTVAISRLPMSQLLHALRQDGSPPLYYMLLHWWMQVFGEGTTAVRAFSGVAGVASLPAMWFVARRTQRVGLAWIAVLLLASSPFAIRYSTEGRMYAMVILLVLVGYLAVLRARERPTLARFAVVSLVAGALLLTHYWGLYLVAAVFLVSVFSAWRFRSRTAVGMAVAVVVGGLAFVPWLPAFRYQMRHTGAPWAARPTLANLIDAVRAYSGGNSSPAQVLWILLLALFALGIFGAANADGRVELYWRGREPGRRVAAAAVGSLALAFFAGIVGNSPVAARYTAVAFPLLIVLAALGAFIMGPRLRWAVTSVAVVLGMASGYRVTTTPRTQTPEVAEALMAQVRPGDLVVYCPDQLGPSTSRLLPKSVNQVTFPGFHSPERVNWVDYQEQIDATDTFYFALAAIQRAGAGDVWLITAPDYIMVSGTCSRLQGDLQTLRPHHRLVVGPSGAYFEQASLIRLWM
ncbi:MAG: hypothetical protein JWL70_1858 [Acidimicrobiia bacterium]|nr:hypothetical protein [Acidimicrobiia bacterium]